MIEIESGPEVSASLDLRWLRARTVEASTEAGLSRGSVTVRIVGAAEMAGLHAQFLGLDSPTDVLTFDLTDGTAAPGFIEAEIAVCFDIAKNEVGNRRPVEAELLLYIVHGILHCLGYNDQDPQEFERMHRREDAILEAIGVGRQFDPEASS
ncbi:MAG: rRNA maturation RNase YbeY [Phycisphaerales bacterium]